MSGSSRTVGAILAGGTASRYGGTAKGLLEVRPGRTIVEHLIEEMSAAGVAEVVIVANTPEPYERFGRKVVPDLRPGNGPLGGIETALMHYGDSRDAVLFCPCDLPGLTRREISRLLAAYRAKPGGVVVAETDDFFWHPLCSVVHNDLLPRVTEALDRGVRSVHELWRQLGAVPVHFDDETPFFNVNTPEDLARWRATGGAGP